MTMARKVIGIGETVFDIIFKDNKPVNAIPGGSTFNSMISLGRCGVPATFLSETGNDHIGNLICSYLEENGVSSADVDKNGKSHLSLAFLNERNNANYVFYKDHPHDKAEMRLPEINADDIILFGSYYAINPVIRHKVKALLDYARKQGAIIYYDLNFRASHKDEKDILLPTIIENFGYADIIRGSNEDFEIVFGYTDFSSIANRDFMQGKTLIYTCGSEPTMLKTSQEAVISHAVQPIEVVSTIGAGDNYNAGVIFSLIRDNISRDSLKKSLTEEQWHDILNTAQSFSAECCKSMENCVSLEFAEKYR